MTAPERSGKIVTFYSYKGGTGRSMALANVAWLLASCGQRVLTIDWDLEAPGLHRYFEPYLTDKSLEHSTGLIDFMLNFATAAVSGQTSSEDQQWYLPYSNLLAHAVSIQWKFPFEGTLDFVPAGRQDAAYANRVNSFNWQKFYELLGGGILIEAVKQNLRSLYDFVLVDSRTGVSDTAGICTVQIPDELVVCFTLNRQSIYGAAAVARSAMEQRRVGTGLSNLKIWPVPMRIERSERDRLEIAYTIARTTFTGLMQHLDPVAIDRYWGEIGVDYEPYYAYEEVLAVFRDRHRRSISVHAQIRRLAERLGGMADMLSATDDAPMSDNIAMPSSKSAWEYIGEFTLLGEEYERIRKEMEAGRARTEQMNLLVERARTLSGDRDVGVVAQYLFGKVTDGARLVGIALARQDPDRSHIDMALECITKPKSAFEQYHALLLLAELTDGIEPFAAQIAAEAIEGQLNVTIPRSDASRWTPAGKLLRALKGIAHSVIRPRSGATIQSALGTQSVTLNECRPTSSFLRYDDPEETHGPFVITRGKHQVRIPGFFFIARYLVTNQLYMEFVRADGYRNTGLWPVSSGLREQFVTADARSMGPASWPSPEAWPEGKAQHPVTGISFLEAQAYVRWCNLNFRSVHNFVWSLPSEDLWEFATRGDAGLIYPWGDAFDASRCNSAEQAIGDTTSVQAFESGASFAGCCDLAGNAWEFVIAEDGAKDTCVLRGGSYKNTSSEVRSYLRLVGVPVWHRPSDFGFRLVQMEPADGSPLRIE
jgi:hypothetical protein